MPLADQIAAANAPILQAADADIAGLQSAVTAAQTDAAHQVADANQAVVLANSAKDAAVAEIQKRLDAANAQLQAAQAAKPNIVVSPTYIPPGDVSTLLAAQVQKPNQTIYLTPDATYTDSGGLQMVAPGVKIVGHNNPWIITGGTSVNMMAAGCEISGVRPQGVALFARVQAANCKLTDVLTGGWLESLVVIQNGADNFVGTDIGGTTRGATIYLVDGPVNPILNNPMLGGSSDEHPLRVSGATNVIVNGGYVSAIGGKVGLAIRDCNGIAINRMWIHASLLFGQGGGDPTVKHVTGGAVNDCIFDCNLAITGGQAELRTGCAVAWARNTHFSSNPKQLIVGVGPGSVFTYAGGNKIKVPAVPGQPLPVRKLVMLSGGSVVGVDDTVLMAA